MVFLLNLQIDILSMDLWVVLILRLADNHCWYRGCSWKHTRCIFLCCYQLLNNWQVMADIYKIYQDNIHQCMIYILFGIQRIMYYTIYPIYQHSHIKRMDQLVLRQLLVDNPYYHLKHIRHHIICMCHLD